MCVNLHAALAALANNSFAIIERGRGKQKQSEWERAGQQTAIAACKNSKQPNEKQPERAAKRRTTTLKKPAKSVQNFWHFVKCRQNILPNTHKEGVKKGRWGRDDTQRTNYTLRQRVALVASLPMLRVAFGIVRHLLLAKIYKIYWGKYAEIYWISRGERGNCWRGLKCSA